MQISSNGTFYANKNNSIIRVHVYYTRGYMEKEENSVEITIPIRFYYKMLVIDKNIEIGNSKFIKVVCNITKVDNVLFRDVSNIVAPMPERMTALLCFDNTKDMINYKLRNA